MHEHDMYREFVAWCSKQHSPECIYQQSQEQSEQSFFNDNASIQQLALSQN